MCIFLNTSSSFQLSLSLKHTSQITFVCGCSVMISVASQRCFCYVVVFFLFVCLFLGSRRVVGGGKGEHNPVSPGSERSQSREGRGGYCPHHKHSHHQSSKFSNTNERSLCLCLPVFLMCFSLSHFLPELHTKPEWASAAPPVFKHLARSLVSSFLQLIQEADKYC